MHIFLCNCAEYCVCLQTLIKPVEGGVVWCCWDVSRQKPLWSETQSDHRYSTTHFTGKPVGIILNCRLCSAFPRALYKWVSGYLSFQRDQLFARSWGLVDGAVVPEDTASGSFLCTHGVGWEEQDSSFSTFLYKYSLSKALSHTYLSPSGSVF